MTRINADIPVQELVGKHLLAEHREIKRIPNTITSGKAKIVDIPEKFKLGAGHVKFFYNKQTFLLRRYKQLFNECVARGYNVTNYESCWDDIPSELFNDYEFTESENNIVRDRIKERLSK